MIATVAVLTWPFKNGRNLSILEVTRNLKPTVRTWKVGLSKKKVVFQSSIFRGELLVSGSEEKRNLSWNQAKYCWFLTANIEAILMKIRETTWNTSSTQHIIWMHVNELVTSVVVIGLWNLFGVLGCFFSSPQNRGQIHRVLGISTAKTLQ